MRAPLLPLLVFGVLLAFLAIGLSLDPSRVSSPLIGSPIPAFSGEHLFNSGVTVNETSLSERPMLVNVWGSWCPGCLTEHELLMRISNEHDIPIYGLNYRDERSLALEWLARHGNPYQLVIYDPDAKIGLEWGIYGAPETFVVDKQGRIKYKHIGILSEKVFNQKILPIINDEFAANNG